MQDKNIYTFITLYIILKDMYYISIFQILHSLQTKAFQILRRYFYYLVLILRAHTSGQTEHI